LERRDFLPEQLAAVAASGEILVEKDGDFLVRVGGPMRE
jgi:hypothetical protein